MRKAVSRLLALAIYVGITIINEQLFIRHLILPLFPDGHIKEHFWIRQHIHHKVFVVIKFQWKRAAQQTLVLHSFITQLPGDGERVVCSLEEGPAPRDQTANASSDTGELPSDSKKR